MALRNGFATLGSCVAATLALAIYILLRPGSSELFLILGLVAACILISYIVAASTATSPFGEFMRGWLVGVNAALNTILGYAIFSHLIDTSAGVIVACAIGILNLLCVLAPVSQNSVYQGLISYLNWFLPMSWPIIILGALFYVVSFALHLLSGGKVAYLKMQDVGADWSTGTLFMKGGLVANLNYLDTAFNMGNFSFVDYKSGNWYKDHEAGHTLNLAAFGSLFHLIGAVDENVFRGANAYSERLAESNSSSGGSNISMWA